jgi:hypothetical protein
MKAIPDGARSNATAGMYRRAGTLRGRAGSNKGKRKVFEMNRFTYWYSGLNRRLKIAIVAGGAAAAVAIAILIAYMVLTPDKVQVRYGTIVRDPISNYVWEDNTQTIMVSPSEAGDYRVEYVDKYTPENEEMLKKKEEQLAEEQKATEGSEGYEAIQTSVSSQAFQDINTLQRNIDIMGQDIVSGMQMANQISSTKSTLVIYRNQVASMSIPPELEPLRQQALQVFDKYISACDLYLRAIAEGNLSYVDQANALINEANDMVQSLIPSY